VQQTCIGGHPTLSSFQKSFHNRPSKVAMDRFPVRLQSSLRVVENSCLCTEALRACLDDEQTSMQEPSAVGQLWQIGLLANGGCSKQATALSPWKLGARAHPSGERRQQLSASSCNTSCALACAKTETAARCQPRHAAPPVAHLWLQGRQEGGLVMARGFDVRFRPVRTAMLTPVSLQGRRVMVMWMLQALKSLTSRSTRRSSSCQCLRTGSRSRRCGQKDTKCATFGWGHEAQSHLCTMTPWTTSFARWQVHSHTLDGSRLRLLSLLSMRSLRCDSMDGFLCERTAVPYKTLGLWWGWMPAATTRSACRVVAAVGSTQHQLLGNWPVAMFA
jgi:hypothetical protein